MREIWKKSTRERGTKKWVKNLLSFRRTLPTAAAVAENCAECSSWSSQFYMWQTLNRNLHSFSFYIVARSTMTITTSSSTSSSTLLSYSLQNSAESVFDFYVCRKKLLFELKKLLSPTFSLAVLEFATTTSWGNTTTPTQIQIETP